MRIQDFAKLADFMSLHDCEKFIVEVVAKGQVSVRLDHKNGTLNFGDKSFEGDMMRSQLTNFGKGLQSVLDMIQTDLKEQFKQQKIVAFKQLAESLDDERRMMMRRRQEIEDRKVFLEEEMRRKAEEEDKRKKQEEEIRRLQEEQRKEEEKKKREEERKRQENMEKELAEKKRLKEQVDAHLGVERPDWAAVAGRWRAEVVGLLRAMPCAEGSVAAGAVAAQLVHGPVESLPGWGEGCDWVEFARVVQLLEEAEARVELEQLAQEVKGAIGWFWSVEPADETPFPPDRKSSRLVTLLWLWEGARERVAALG
jgi:hypothetical protein